MGLSNRFARAARPRGEVSAAEEARALAILEANRGRPPIRPAPIAARHAAQILKPFLDKAPMGLDELKRRWAEIAGERIAKASAPEKLARGVLTICAPGALAPFIQHQETLILERCRLAGAAVKTLTIRQGSPVAYAPPVRAIQRALAAEDEAAIDASLSAIEAEPLKAALSRLARAVRRS
ncbi:MAG: DciA family protein [Hyphomonadaceae bacterium]